MCATKPSASWPHSPSRTSSSACALDGIRSSPRHGLSPVSRLGVVRVVGDRDRPGVRHRHRHRAHAHHPGDAEPLDHVAHRAGERLPAGVRLGPVQQEVRRPAGVVQQPDDEPRRVVGLVVVAHEGHRPAGGRGSRAARRRRRSPRPARRTGRRGAGPPGPPRCPASRKPSSTSTMVSAEASSSSGTSSTMCTRRGSWGTRAVLPVQSVLGERDSGRGPHYSPRSGRPAGDHPHRQVP